MSLIELNKVKKSYQQGKIEVPALRGIDLTIEQGEFVTIFGPSGSGKTTFLNMIGCLDTPTEGEICLNGRKISGLSKKKFSYKNQRGQVLQYNIYLIYKFCG